MNQEKLETIIGGDQYKGECCGGRGSVMEDEGFRWKVAGALELWWNQMLVVREHVREDFGEELVERGPTCPVCCLVHFLTFLVLILLFVAG